MKSARGDAARKGGARDRSPCRAGGDRGGGPVLGWILRIYPCSRGIWLDEKRARSCMISRNKAGLKLAGGASPSLVLLSVLCLLHTPCQPERLLDSKSRAQKQDVPAPKRRDGNGEVPSVGWLLRLYPCFRGIRLDSREGEIQRSRYLAGLKLAGWDLPRSLSYLSLVFCNSHAYPLHSREPVAHKAGRSGRDRDEGKAPQAVKPRGEVPGGWISWLCPVQGAEEGGRMEEEIG